MGKLIDIKVLVIQFFSSLCTTTSKYWYPIFPDLFFKNLKYFHFVKYDVHIHLDHTKGRRQKKSRTFGWCPPQSCLPPAPPSLVKVPLFVGNFLFA